MIKLNFCKKVSRKYFCVANGLAFLTVITMCSCEDNVSNNITGDIDAIEESVVYESDETGITRKESIEEIVARADAQFHKTMNLRKNRVAMASGIPHYVGVLSATGGCPSGAPNISYVMDCENSKNNTKFENVTCNNCYRPKGAQIIPGGDIWWSICIVDANKYYFPKMEYSYAIFDFSTEQYLGDRRITNIHVHSDDEDTNNHNRFKNTSYGFERSEFGYPTQMKRKNTEFWLLYFEADDTQNKLPNLGFDYDVFSNFKCQYETAAILIADTEDNDPSNNVRIYEPATNTKPADDYNKNGDWVDSKFNIIKNGKGHMYYAIQNTKGYRY